MSDILVTADANLLTSGALRMRPDAALVRFLDAWLAGRFALILSDHLLGEVERTLAKPYFARRLAPEDRAVFGDLLRRRARITLLTVTVLGIATHPEDDLVLATALSGGAQFLITGDHRLLERKTYQSLMILDVRAFLATLPGL
jgi:predicted nucleic acid-binding protein